MSKKLTLRRTSAAAIVLTGLIASACGQSPDSGKSDDVRGATIEPTRHRHLGSGQCESSIRHRPGIGTRSCRHRGTREDGAYLRGLKAFQVRSASTRDEVLVDGQKIAFANDVDLLAQRKPDRFRAEVVGDKHQRTYLYDGSSFTLLPVGSTTTPRFPPPTPPWRFRMC